MSTLNHPSSHLRLSHITVLLLLTMAMLVVPASAQKVDITNLPSDLPAVSTYQDAHLVNPWGLSISPTSPWWVSDNTSGYSTLYNGSGQPQSLVVTIPSGTGSGTGSPSGTVYNASTTDFQIHGIATPFLFCTEDGTIQGGYAGSMAFIAVNNNGNGAVYKGMALGSVSGTNYLYVANFNAGTVEVYNGSYQSHSFGS